MRRINPRRETETLLRRFRNYRSALEERNKTIEKELTDRYPYEVYGCMGEIKVRDKMQKFRRDKEEIQFYIRCLENSIWTVDEEMKKINEKTYY